MKPFAIFNPNAANKRSAARAEQLMQELRQRHIPWQPVERGVSDSIERTLRRALQQGFDTLIVGGGDGTLNRAVRCAHDLGALDTIRFSIVPIGTCNDFYRQFGPRAFSTRTRLGDLDRPTVECDLGLINGRPFVNNAGFGRRLESFRRREGPAKTVMGFRPIPAVITNGAETVDRRPLYMALAFNGPYFSGGLFLDKESRFHDGFLDVCWIPASLWRITLLVKLMMLRAAGAGFLEDVRRLRTRRATFELGEPVWPQADGEPPDEDPVTRVEISMSPARWRLIPPAA